MIEENFSELDGDFVKVCSRCILNGTMSGHEKDIEKLAELGQINAIIEYFYANPKQVNPLIEKNLNENKSENFNVLYAKSLQIRNKYFQNGDNSLPELIKQRKSVCKEIDEFDFFSRISVQEVKTRIEIIKNLNKKKETIESQILDNEFVKYVNLALSSCFETWQKTADPVVLETFCEMGLKHREILFGKNKDVLDYIGAARKFLGRTFWKDMKDLAVKFAYSKNMIMFSKDENQRREGTKILKTLANEKVSNTLKTYQLQGSGSKFSK